MSDDPDKATKPVSMSKSDTKAPPAPVRPRSILGSVVALAGSALAALIAAIALFGQRGWLETEQKKANATTVTNAVKDATAKATKAGDSAADIHAAAVKAAADARKKFPDLHHQVSQQQSSAFIGTLVVVAALGVIGFSVYRGRYWSRWGVVGFWLLASFTGTMVGIGTVLSVGASVPAAFKVPSFLAGALLIAAVVLVNLPTSRVYFAHGRPTPSPDAPVRRGLFAPRTPPGGGRPAAGRGSSARPNSILTSSAASRGEAYVERQRAKKRAVANQESIARGAELARSRAKASKSRRIEP